jgi:hypothetical protein
MTPAYVAYGIVLLLVLAALSGRMRMWLRICLLLLAAFLLVAAALVFPESLSLGKDDWYEASPYKELILFVLMLLGMTARALSLAIEERKKTLSTAAGGAPGLNIDLWDFVYPFLVSFITFGAVMSQIGTSPLGLTTMIFAFQNGFFWQTLIKNK